MTPSVRTFGKYLLDEEIARGGMSRVHLGRLRGLGGFEKRLVVKQVLPELASDPRFVSMFVQEAKTLVQMSHPHIVPVYELGVVDGVYFLAMEYVEGATLSQILAQGPLAPELVAHLGAEVCDALHYAHERFSIVHRDVTPRNVIVDPEGHSRLLDFGIAAPADDEETELFGTPGYLSPEQLEGEAVPASDIFSLGAALFEALAGRQAFPAQTVEESRAALAEPGPDFDERGDVPPELAKIVLKALERDPGDRYETARELGRALRGFLASHSPEGVAPELGACAVLAESQVQRQREARDEDDEDDAPPDSGGKVQTLAANRAFEELISESERPPPMFDDEGDDAPGTMPIEGRRSLAPARVPEVEDEEEEESDRSEPRDDEDDVARDEDGPSTTALERPAGARGEPQREPSASPRSLPVLFAIASLVVVGVGIYAISAPPEPDPRTNETLDAGVLIAANPPVEDAGPGDAGPSPDAGAPVTPDAGPLPDAGPRDDPTVSPGGRATLTVNARPWADVILDGRELGHTPQRNLSIRAGAHTLELRNEYLAAPLRRRFEVEAGASLTAFANLEDESPSIQIR